MSDHHSILKRLTESGFEAFIVGGYVRDFLCGQKANDVDICTSASPEEICRLFQNDCKVSDIDGTSFRVIKVDGIEVAQFRKDIEHGHSKKEHETVPAQSIIEDLERRDLTINSIAMSPEGNIVDPFNGTQDLKNKLIRFTGNPVKRISDDPERILRAHRFCAKLGETARFEPKTAIALIENIALLKYIRPERHRKEILKAMDLEHPSIFFETLHMTGGLELILPSLAKTVGHEHGKHHPEDIFTHSLAVGDAIPKDDPILRFAGFIHDIGKPSVWNGETFIDHETIGAQIAFDELKGLTFSNDEIEKICGLIRMHMRSILGATPKATRRVVKCLKENGVSPSDWLELHIADKKGNFSQVPFTNEEINQMIETFDKVMFNINEPAAFAITDLKITGFDVMKILNVKPGKIVGDTLKWLLDLVLDDPELNTRDTLITLVEKSTA